MRGARQGASLDTTATEVDQTIEDGREMARRIRSFVITQLGSDSKHLSQFGIPPRQKKGRKSKPVPPPVEAVPAPPKPAGSTGQ